MAGGEFSRNQQENLLEAEAAPVLKNNMFYSHIVKLYIFKNRDGQIYQSWKQY